MKGCDLCEFKIGDTELRNEFKSLDKPHQYRQSHQMNLKNAVGLNSKNFHSEFELAGVVLNLFDQSACNSTALNCSC